MGYVAVLVASLGVLSAVPTDTTTEQPRLIASMPTHAIRGVVKSFGASVLTIVTSGKKNGELTFVLGASTHREGQICIGGTVSVRYRREGGALVATAVSAHPEKH